ncbi:hypothetical protein [Flavobacterium eburneipallidum]|uniref:hypothetical protein n=1 Tax=Flavobacterium eburneipallidum TaxID=3003263 RepID=UPI0022AC251E|nr:hypothetical protein [Flavobacterium eburneipallidum]
MKTTIEQELTMAIENSSKKFKDEVLLNQFEKASEEFEKLVSLGIVKKRGNNLISITDTHLHKSNLNKPNVKDKYPNDNFYLSNI